MISTKRTFENGQLQWKGPSTRPSYGPFGGNGMIGANLWESDGAWHIGLDHAKVWDMRLEGRPWDQITFTEICDTIKEGSVEQMESITHRFHGEGQRNPINLNLAKLDLKFAGDIFHQQIDESIQFQQASFGSVLKSEGHAVELKAWVAKDQNRVWVNLHNTGNRSLAVTLHLARTAFDPKLEEELQYPPSQSLPGVGFTQELHKGMNYGVCVMDETGKALLDETVSIAQGSYFRFCIAVVEGASVEEVMNELENPDVNYSLDLEHHLQWWKSFWSKSKVEIEDSDLNAIWYNGLYTLASCSHQQGPPVTLQGLWTEDGAPGTWGGHIFSNLNTQISYWACCGANHPELLKPLVDFLLNDQIMATMESETKAFYGLPGLSVPVATDLEGRRIYSWLPVQIWTTAGAWLGQALWDYIQSTGDRETLERAYPWFCKAETFLTAYVHRKSEDKVDFSPSHSPELFDLTPESMWMSNPTMDLWIYKRLLQICVEASKKLNVDDDKREVWLQRLDQLPKYPSQERRPWSDGSGRFDEVPAVHHLVEGEAVVTELSHRHLSHCAPIYPGCDVNVEDESCELAKNSIQQNIRRGTGLWIGYSFVWQSCLASRCKMNAMAYHHIKTYWNHFTAPNGFHANGETSGVGISDFNREYYDHLPVSVEATLAAPAAIQEMLLQSWGHQLRVFPALPLGIAASFEGLRTEVGDVVSASINEKGDIQMEIQVCEGLCDEDVHEKGFEKARQALRIQVHGEWSLLNGILMADHKDVIEVEAVKGKVSLKMFSS